MGDPRIAAARDNFGRGCNCAQAVLCAFGPGLGLDEPNCRRLTAAFGGGIAQRGETCGAVVGALLTLGLAEAGRGGVYESAAAFLERFSTANGDVRCRELLGEDISTTEGLARAYESGAFLEVCPRLVAGAAELLVELLETDKGNRTPGGID
jgi:C_GCAxxG_C_C family probable redox protein